MSGLINIEITLRVESFPLEYVPTRYPFFGVNSEVSGVGFNIAKALTTLGDTVDFLSIIGKDLAGGLVRARLRQCRISEDFIVEGIEQTAHSVIIFDKDGKRQIHVDLKDIQERVYPKELFGQALKECSLAVLCNINFSRPFLRKAKQAGKPIATDVHGISNLDDVYNRDFIRAADILFMSDELLPHPPEEWVKKLRDRCGTEIIVVGLGAEGALLSVKSDRFLERVPAVRAPKIVNTIGAGDALFSCFVHCYNKSGDPYESIRKAVAFASHKIGETCAAEGFLTEPKLNALYAKLTAAKP